MGTYRLFYSTGPLGSHFAPAALEECPLGFPSLVNAQKALAILCADPFAAARVVQGGATVWQNRAMDEWQRTAENLVGSSSWADRWIAETGHRLETAGFTFGDWRVYFTLERRVVCSSPNWYALDLSVHATRPGFGERAPWGDVVNSAGALQRKRFYERMPVAAAAWREFKNKPAPYHPTLQQQIHDQALGFIDRLRHLVGPRAQAIARGRQTIAVPFGDATWAATLQRVFEITQAAPGRCRQPSGLAQWRKAAEELRAQHACCEMHSVQRGVLHAQSARLSRDRLAIDIDATADRLGGAYCCDVAMALAHAERVSACLKTGGGTNGSQEQLVAREGAGYRLLELSAGQSRRLVPLLATRDWISLRLPGAVHTPPALAAGKGADPALLARAQFAADRLHKLEFEDSSGYQARLGYAGLDVYEDGTVEFREPTYQLVKPDGRSDYGRRVYLERKGGHMFNHFYARQMGEPLCRRIRAGIRRLYAEHDKAVAGV